MREISSIADKKPGAKRKKSASQMPGAGFSQSVESPTDTIMFLQRTIGNQAVQRLIKYGALQAKLRIDKSGGRYEQKAVTKTHEPSIQQKCTVCDDVQQNQSTKEEEEEEVSEARMIQRKLTIGAPEDVYEQEANKVAEQVSQGGIFSDNVNLNHSQQEIISNLDVSRVLGFVENKRQEITHKDNSTRKLRISRNEGESYHEEKNIPSSLENRILQSKGMGSLLPPLIQKTMELQTGYDFSNVRVKTDSEAAELNRSLGARAFTNGSDIWLGRGEKVTDTKLMAHELTHVVQQGAAKRIGLKSTSIYRKEILQFQKENSPDKIAAMQQQILETPGSMPIDLKENSQTLRGCIPGCSSTNSCSASATGVALGPSTAVNDGTRWGMITPIIVRGSNLSQVQDSESVSSSIDHTGCFSTRPSARSSNSGWMPADQIPPDNHTSGISDHLSYFDNNGGGTCSYSRLQLDLFKIPSCGINTPQPIPHSGYRLKREIKGEGGTRVRATITKTAEAVTVDGKSTTAGLTAKREETMIIRP